MAGYVRLREIEPCLLTTHLVVGVLDLPEAVLTEWCPVEDEYSPVADESGIENTNGNCPMVGADCDGVAFKSDVGFARGGALKRAQESYKQNSKSSDLRCDQRHHKCDNHPIRKRECSQFVGLFHLIIGVFQNSMNHVR